MKSLDIRLTDKEKRNQVLLCLNYTGLKVNKQGGFSCLSLWERWLSVARTERALSVTTLSVTCGDSYNPLSHLR